MNQIHNPSPPKGVCHAASIELHPVVVERNGPSTWIIGQRGRISHSKHDPVAKLSGSHAYRLRFLSRLLKRSVPIFVQVGGVRTTQYLKCQSHRLLVRYSMTIPSGRGAHDFPDAIQNQCNSVRSCRQ